MTASDPMPKAEQPKSAPVQPVDQYAFAGNVDIDVPAFMRNRNR